MMKAGSGPRPRRRGLTPRAASPGVQTPGPRPDGGDIEEDEAVERRDLAMGEEGPRALGEMELPVDDGELPGGEEGDGPGEEPEDEQGPAHGLDDPADPELRQEADGVAAPRETEELH